MGYGTGHRNTAESTDRPVGPRENDLRVSGVVLAGGESRRLGTRKALVKVGGIPLIARVLEPVRQVSSDVLVVTADPAPYQHLGLPLVCDAWPGMGALGGIYSGLQMARYPRALVVACDMPFLNLALLRYMISLAEDYDIVIPAPDGLFEPLHAIYSKACLAPIESLLRAGCRRIADLLCHVHVRRLQKEEVDRFDPEGLAFFNVNTPEDLARAQELAGSVDSALRG
mgnify:CR=1 FL=1